MTLGPGLQRTPLPKGFLAGGSNCGVRRYRPDLGVLLSSVPATAAAVYTKNLCAAACVQYNKSILPSKNVRALITNSGQANAATGSEGVEKNFLMAQAVATKLGCATTDVLTASTGVIGVQLEIDKIASAVPELIQRATDSAENFALAIMTTDLIPKSVSTTLRLSQGTVRITGICKGSGMIHPNMATMLGYLLTDVSLEMDEAQAFLTQSVDESFNMISVDGDTSTNDMVFLMANGASGVSLATDADRAAFQAMLLEVAQSLARSIARDGEGATKLIEVQVENAPETDMARRAARGITLSPLIKAAIHGEDPNWGRILAKLGAEQVPLMCLERLTLKIQGTKVFSEGKPMAFDRDKVREKLKKDTIKVNIDMASGGFGATAWGCDLSKKYVDINAEYTT